MRFFSPSSLFYYACTLESADLDAVCTILRVGSDGAFHFRKRHLTGLNIDEEETSNWLSVEVVILRPTTRGSAFAKQSRYPGMIHSFKSRPSRGRLKCPFVCSRWL
eukprot:scaffold35012_cov214-Amphora_coffeaeformis.AAC.5